MHFTKNQGMNSVAQSTKKDIYTFSVTTLSLEGLIISTPSLLLLILALAFVKHNFLEKVSVI